MYVIEFSFAKIIFVCVETHLTDDEILRIQQYQE